MSLPFYGNFNHSLDSKGRAIVPSSFREPLGERFTICINYSFNGIALYPLEKWRELSAKFAKIPDTDEFGTDYKRLIIGNAFIDGMLDAQGRIMFPSTLRSKVGLEKNIRFVGLIDYAEVWDEETYNSHSDTSEGRSAALLAHVNEIFTHG